MNLQTMKLIFKSILEKPKKKGNGMSQTFSPFGGGKRAYVKSYERDRNRLSKNLDKIVSSRDKEIALARIQGQTLEQISFNHQITRERVRQIISEVSKSDYSGTKKRRGRKPNQRSKYTHDRIQTVKILLSEGKSVSQIAQKMGLSQSSVYPLKRIALGEEDYRLKSSRNS